MINKKILILILFISFILEFSVFCQIGITENEIINIAIDEIIDKLSLFKNDNFMIGKTKYGNKVIFGRSQNRNDLTSIQIFFNKIDIETILISIPIVNQDGNQNDLSFKITDKIIKKIINEDIDNLLKWGFETNDPEQYSFYKEKITNNVRLVFFSVLPDLIVIILTTDLDSDFKNLKNEKYVIEK